MVRTHLKNRTRGWRDGSDLLSAPGLQAPWTAPNPPFSPRQCVSLRNTLFNLQRQIHVLPGQDPLEEVNLGETRGHPPGLRIGGEPSSLFALCHSGCAEVDQETDWKFGPESSTYLNTKWPESLSLAVSTCSHTLSL